MLDSEKYKAAVHYIIASCDDPIKLGSIKLNKILFYSDSDMFFNTGESITNDEYIKRQFGPVPKNILEILKELEDEKKIAIHKVRHGHYEQTIFVSLNDPDLTKLTAQDVDAISYNNYHICNDYTAKEISETTHNEIWEMADIGEVIPLYTVHADKLGEIDENDIKNIEEALSECQ